MKVVGNGVVTPATGALCLRRHRADYGDGSDRLVFSGWSGALVTLHDNPNAIRWTDKVITATFAVKSYAPHGDGGRRRHRPQPVAGHLSPRQRGHGHSAGQ